MSKLHCPAIDKKNTKKYKWQVKSSKTLVKNKYLNLKLHKSIRSNGSKVDYYILHRDDYVCVLPFDGSHFWLVGQYRLTAKAYMWESVQGGVDGKESLQGAAKRELLEETGFTAKKWTKLGSFHLAQGICDQKGHVFLAENLTKVTDKIGEDEGEILKIKKVTPKELKKMVEIGELFDASTLLCYYWYKEHKTKKA